MGTAPNPADVEDGLDQVGNLESAVEPMPTFTSVNPAPCRVGPPHSRFYRSRSSQGNQNWRLRPPCTSVADGCAFSTLTSPNPRSASRHAPGGQQSVAWHQVGAVAPEAHDRQSKAGGGADDGRHSQAWPAPMLACGYHLCLLRVCT